MLDLDVQRDVTKPHPYLLGRAIGYVPLVLLCAAGASFAFWHASIDVDRCGVPVVEALSVLAVTAAAWALTPRMASWEATAMRSVRRLSTVASAAVLAGAAVVPLLVYVAVTRMPIRFVPGSGRFELSEVEASTFAPMLTNVALLGGAAMMLVVALGRPLGALVTLTSYGLLFAIATETTTPTGYAAFCTYATPRPNWPVATIAVVAALAVWYRTGGTTNLSRHLDPRHRG